MPVKKKKQDRLLIHKVWFVIFLLLTGCTAYRLLPLTTEAVQHGLATPSDETIRIKASQIKHPILKPIAFDGSDGISPDEAAIFAVIANPSLRAVRDARGIAAAQVLQAGILPNPQLSFSFESPVGGNTSDKVNALGAGLNWDISSLLARDTRISAARSHAHSIDLEIAWKEWQVAEAARLDVYRLFIAKKRLSLTNESRHLAARLHETLEKGVAIGIDTASHLATVQSLLQDARTRYLQSQAKVNAERLELNRILGLPSDRKIKLESDIVLPTIASIPSTSELIRDLENTRLDLLALRYGYKSQDERLRAAIQSQFPKIGLGLTGARDTDAVKTVGVGISISLPIFDRNQGRIALERATRQQLFDEYTARFFKARSDVAKIDEELHSTFDQLQDVEKTIEKIKQLSARYRKATEQGNLNIVELYRILLRLNDKKLEKLALQRRLVELAIGLEIASGRYLDSQFEGKERTRKSACDSEDMK